MSAATPFWEAHPGHGPHLLLIHGFLSSRAQWQPNLDALAEVCTPVVMELYGHGRSPAPDDPDAYTTAGYARAIETIREALGAERWFVCGYSLGAAISIRYALTHPERLLGHVFTNSSSAFATDETTQQWAAHAAAAAEGIRQGGLAAIEKIAVHPRRARNLDPAIHQALLRDAALLNPAGGANTMRFTNPTASVRAELAHNTARALLCCGRHEKRFADHRRFAAETMPNLTIADLDAGHAVNMQDAATFNDVVTRFIRAP